MEKDDFKNRCGGRKYPLLHKVHDMLNGKSKNSFECNFEDVTPALPSLSPRTQSPTTHSPTTQSSVLFKNL
jgi:hypothetical protein